MKSLIVMLVALLALVGAAAADSISGSASYQWNGGGLIQGTGTQSFSSGMALTLNLGNPATPVGISQVGNTMALTVNQPNPNANIVLQCPISATQFGSNSIALNNGQEPGTTNPQIMDFVSTSTSGGSVSYASEGIGALVAGTPVSSVGASFTAKSVGKEAATGNYLDKNILVTDTNTVSGYATPDTMFYNVPTVFTGDILTSHLKSGTFDWNCVDQADVKFENSYTKDQIIGTGIASSAVATGEANPLVNGLSGATSGLSTYTHGTQQITITTSLLPLQP